MTFRVIPKDEVESNRCKAYDYVFPLKSNNLEAKVILFDVLKQKQEKQILIDIIKNTKSF